MKRSGSLSRRTRLRRGGALPRRGRARFRSYVPDKAYQRWVRGQGCLIHDSRCSSVWDVAHVVSRGAGGADRDNVVCLCRHHHEEQHRIGIKSFEQRYGVDLRRVAQDLWDTYQGER